MDDLIRVIKDLQETNRAQNEVITRLTDYMFKLEERLEATVRLMQVCDEKIVLQMRQEIAIAKMEVICR